MSDNGFIGLVIVVAVIGALSGFTVGAVLVKRFYTTEAVERGCASYDTKTGEWGWKP